MRARNTVFCKGEEEGQLGNCARPLNEFFMCITKIFCGVSLKKSFLKATLLGVWSTVKAKRQVGGTQQQ